MWPFDWHRHHYREHIGGVYADEPNGPRLAHEIWWQCDCGKFHCNADLYAAVRALRGERQAKEREE